MQRLKLLAAAAILAAATAFSASAASIDPGSRVGFTSPFAVGVTLVNSVGNPVALDDPSAVALDFNGADLGLGSAAIGVGGRTGTFLSIITGPTTGTINGFTFSPFAAVTPLYTLFSTPNILLDLTSITKIMQSATGFQLDGTGIFRIAGYDNTAAEFSFTTQQAGSGVGFSIEFSANTVAVPEPASLALLGAGLLGLGIARRARRKQA